MGRYTALCLRQTATTPDNVASGVAHGVFSHPDEAHKECAELIAMGCEGPHVVAYIEDAYAGDEGRTE